MCPIDVILYNWADTVAPWFHSHNFSPNDVTTLSFVAGVASLVYLRQGDLFMFVVLYSVGYFFDCLDGFMARKYNLMSPLGDIYDHITDVVVQVGLLYVVLTKYRSGVSPRIIQIYLLTVFLTATHLACQQVNSPWKEPETLDLLKPLCPNKEFIRYSRYFGTGGFTVIVLFLVIYVVSSKK